MRNFINSMKGRTQAKNNTSKQKSGEAHEVDLAHMNDLNTASSSGYFALKMQNRIESIDENLMVIRLLPI